MNNLFKVSSNKVRPWGAVFITISMLLNTILFILGFISNSFNPIIGVFVLFSALVTYGLWVGKNWAWALIIISSVLNLIQITGVQSELFGEADAGRYVLAIPYLLTLVVTFLPKTIAFYKSDKGEVNQLSVSPKRLVKVFLIFIVFNQS